MKPADLPSVEAIEVLEGQPAAARLKLDTGRTVFLSPDMTPRACLMPKGAQGFAVMLTDWKQEDGPAYHVPASLLDTLARVFDMSAEQAHALPAAKKKPISIAWKKDASHFPHVVNVESLPEGAARLHLADGQSTDIEDTADARLSPEEYAPTVLSVMEGQSKGLYIVPDALRFAVMGALGYAPPEGASLEAVSLEEAPTAEGGRAVLACRLEDGTPYAYRLSVPAAFDLSGRRSEAMRGKPYTLTIHPHTGRAAVLSVPAHIWPEVAPVLTEGGEA